MMRLPDALAEEVDSKLPRRALQAQQLACFLSPSAPPVPALIIYGPRATGKTSLLKLVLGYHQVTHVVVQCRECITGRHLLERTLLACIDAVRDRLEDEINWSLYSKCENLSVLAASLQSLLQGRGRFVLVFDNIDEQREAPPTLMPALARLNEYIPTLTVVLVIAAPRQGFLHRMGSPYVAFPAYTREDLLAIVARNPLPLHTSIEAEVVTNGQTKKVSEIDVRWLWEQFIAAVFDSQGHTAANDLLTFQRLVRKLWLPFVASVRDGTYGPRDFSRLMVAKRGLFQSEDSLLDKIIPDTKASTSGPQEQVKYPYNELPYYTKHLLVAAYLASRNQPRTDSVLFSHTEDRKRRKKGGASAANRASKHRKAARRLMSPSAFPVERLLAIFHALLTYDVKSGVDVYAEIATLTELRLLVRSGTGGDPLDAASAKWRTNIGWEAVVGIGRSVGVEVADYMAE